MSSRALDRLRQAGLSLDVADGELQIEPASKLTPELRDLVVDHRAEIRGELHREAAFEELGLVSLDRVTGRPDLSAEEPPAEDQVRRLRQLARDPAFGEKRERVAEIVEDAVAGGLTKAGAYHLVGKLGERIHECRQEAPRRDRPEGGTCRDCGRTIGPTSSTCGTCKRTRAGRELLEPARLQELARDAWADLLEAVAHGTETFVEDQLPTRGRVALEAIGGWSRLRQLEEEHNEGRLRRARTRFAQAFVGASRDELQTTTCRGESPVE